MLPKRPQDFESAYLRHPNRLGDVVAAIQLLATFRYYQRPVDSWADVFGKGPDSAEDWGTVFREHPEFFLVGKGGGKAVVSLAWRRAYPRLYHTRQSRELSWDERGQLPESEARYISRRPLSEEQVQTLINTAVELHGRAIAHSQEARWWIPVGTALLGVMVGALVTLFAK